MNSRMLPWILFITGAAAAAVGFWIRAVTFCIENCSPYGVSLIPSYAFYGGIALMVTAIVLAIYQSKLPKKPFVVGTIVICVIILGITVTVKYKNAKYKQRLNACISSIQPGEDATRCNLIK